MFSPCCYDSLFLRFSNTIIVATPFVEIDAQMFHQILQACNYVG
jgi:hypothetical protein